MKKGYWMVIGAVLAACMIMAISNMYGNALADPTHCDQPGRPSCYKVGYDDGLGRSDPCPTGHSAAFCTGWYVATHSNNLGLGPPSQQQQQTAKAYTDCSQTYLTQNERYNCGYNRGYLDAQRDWNLHRFPPQSGGDNSCPHATEHTPEYCNGYEIGYTASWNVSLNQGNTAEGSENASTAQQSQNQTQQSQNQTQQSQNQALTATNFLKYENSTYGIKMQYPSDWRVEGGSNPSIIATFYPQRDYRSDVIVQVENLTTSYTLNQYLNRLMHGDAADSKDFPDIEFTNNTTSDVELTGHPGYLLNGTFTDPNSGALYGFTNIGTIIGDKAYSVIYYSPVQRFPVHIPTFSQMIESFEILPQQSQPAFNASTANTPPATTTPSTVWQIGLLVIFLIIIGAVWKLRHRGENIKKDVISQ
jgi:hypothetical protein